MGGTDTTTAWMEWAMAELVTHPCNTQTPRRGLHGSRRLNPWRRRRQCVAQLDCLKAVVKETLRLHAPVPLLVPRELLADAEILGYHVPARTTRADQRLGHRPVPRDVGQRVLEFVPERFLGSSAATVDFSGQRFELLPIGAGRRVCPVLGLPYL